MTKWTDVPGYEGRYRVSDKGQVYSLLTERTLSTPVWGDYCIVRLSKDGQTKTKKLHCIVAEAFIGSSPFEGALCRHLNDVKTDNRAENLAWGTHSDNQTDRVRNEIHTSSNKTHCPNGHEYTEENTYTNKKGQRHCKECNRVRARNNWRKKNWGPNWEDMETRKIGRIESNKDILKKARML